MKDVRFIVRADADLKSQADAFCRENGITVSDFVRNAFVKAIGRAKRSPLTPARAKVKPEPNTRKRSI